MAHLKHLQRNNKKIILIFLAVSILVVINLFVGKKTDPLAEYKKQVNVELSPEAKQTLDKALSYIQNDNMDGLFKLMAHNNLLSFKENYVNGLFAGKDFCPVRISDGQAVKFAKSKHNHVIVRIYSEKRRIYYLVSLQKIKNNYKIYSIMQDITEGEK